MVRARISSDASTVGRHGAEKTNKSPTLTRSTTVDIVSRPCACTQTRTLVSRLHQGRRRRQYVEFYIAERQELEFENRSRMPVLTAFLFYYR